ncbi:MAG: YicC family protein [Planctomycetes bacterium]|nr:YicC family protein [Planctomycetota bacterium]
MRSMTGFGAAQTAAARGGATLRVEVRAVNHKFLQVKVRLPQDLSFLESEVEELVRKRLERGAVQLNVFASGPSGVETVAIDHARLASYRKELTKLAKELALDESVKLDTLLGLPGVVGTGVDASALKRREKEVLALVERALDALGEMREVEGKALAKDLAKHASEIQKLVARIEKRMPEVVLAHREALTKRVAELLGPAQKLDPADLAREVALLADKLDVAEELSRLESHLAQLAAITKKDGPVGRQLDFLVQEIFRETNTIGSKCSDASVAHAVVELKTLIERLREQVQNVE